MKNTLSLKVEKREIFGKKVKRLRREGLIPANIYGRKIKSEAVSVQKSDFDEVFKEAGETQIVNLELGKEKRPVLIHDIQKDPVTGDIIHIDFLQVDLKEKVTASIPVVGVGESPVEKQGLGTVVFYVDEIEVEALPTDLLERVEVDLSSLENIDQTILVKDLAFDTSKVEVKASPDEVVVKVEPVKEESVEETAPVEEAAAEAIQPQKEETPSSGTEEENNNNS